jgi:hypothetical protein
MKNNIPFSEKKLGNEECIGICMTDERRRRMWKVTVWGLKGFWRDKETRICSICRKQEELFHIMECKK